MNTYEEKRQSRIERLEKRIESLRKFSEGKDLSLFGEEKSGIPLGQPILVGHHSERRHRRHLERINRLIEKGYNASKMADRLEDRLKSIHYNKSIQVDNPDAKDLIKSKLEKLEKKQECSKFFNKLVRKYKDPLLLAAEIEKSPFAPKKYSSLDWATKLLTPDFAGRLGIPDYELTNTSAEIRRLKKRLIELDKIESANESWSDRDFENGVSLKLIDGQYQAHFPGKPDDNYRTKLKSHPLSLKWSTYSKAWVRKQTGSTGPNWLKALETTLKEYK